MIFEIDLALAVGRSLEDTINNRSNVTDCTTG